MKELREARNDIMRGWLRGEALRGRGMILVGVV